MSSRQAAHLPPRCPFQKKPISRSVYGSISPSSSIDSESCNQPRHHKSSSQSSILDEQPAWLDDLLSDRDSQSKGTFHRRSASDSVTMWDGLADSFSGLSARIEGENSVDSDAGTGLESNCIYGPNSPRRKGNLTFSEKAIVSALSEYVSLDPAQCLDGGIHFSGISYLDSEGAGCSLNSLNMETKPPKRHAGQRSRVRKLQYIAELEKTVNVFETLESELTVRIASLAQQRIALSLENSKLKQQVARIQHEKLIMEGQYQSLKKEAERLKAGLVNSPNSKATRYYGLLSSASTARADISKTTWQMLELDLGKLHLNSN